MNLDSKHLEEGDNLVITHDDLIKGRILIYVNNFE